jgi:hypothetical protein
VAKIAEWVYVGALQFLFLGKPLMMVISVVAQLEHDQTILGHVATHKGPPPLASLHCSLEHSQ